MDKLNISRSDLSGQVTRTALWIADMTAANFDAHQSNALQLASYMDDLCQSDAHLVSIAQGVQSSAKDNVGTREIKWLVHFHDTVNFKEFTIEIGNADTTLPMITQTNGVKLLDPTSTEFTNFSSAMALFCRSAYNNGISVDYIELVGRNI